jgi:glycosyltransferase involved in cell wall biosynthesis
MKIIVTANSVPYIVGGADYHINGLLNNLKLHGHDVEIIRYPFKFTPESAIQQLMHFCQGYDLNYPNGIRVDKVISLQFPGYGIQHDNHTVWLMHQHRAVYELYSQQIPGDSLQQLQQDIVRYDNAVLSAVKTRYANSRRVSQRLKHYNQLDATPLYHPPFGEQHFYTETAKDYIFCPSRLERLKRQDLLIEAARYTQTPVVMIISGEGGQKDYYQSLISQYHLEHKVRLTGLLTEQEKYAFYAYSLAVFFAPFDEDYGYITLEAMLSGKPVITCHDSGGPLEFVEHDVTGYILAPDPKVIAAKIDELYQAKAHAEKLGQQALAHYQAKHINWNHVVQTLTL